MSCASPGATHHMACDCRESDWAAKLAAAEERIREMESRANAREAEVQAHMEGRYAAEERARRMEHAARCCARELTYVAEVEPVGGPLLAHSGEGDACVALVESLCGPMAAWPEEEEMAQERLRSLTPPPEAEKRGEGE